MTKNMIKTLTIFCLLTSIVSCDRPVCKNTNAIFDKYSPDTKEYNDELVKQLAKVDKSKLTYWMDTYQKDNIPNTSMLTFRVTGSVPKLSLL